MYTVERVDTTAPQGTVFHLTGYRRPLLRFELKKVADVQRYSNNELRSAFDVVKYGAAVPPPPPAHALPEGIPQAPSMSHNPSREQIRAYNNWADHYRQPRFGAHGPAAEPVRRQIMPRDVAFSLRSEGGHRMVTRNMRASYFANK